jgi:hypothetical protein
MRPIYKLLGIAVVAFVVGGGIGVSVQAARSPSAVVIARARLAEGLKVAQASQTSQGSSQGSNQGSSQASSRESNQGSKHACVDLNGGSFEWRWANVPFASSCDARPDAK